MVVPVVGLLVQGGQQRHESLGVVDHAALLVPGAKDQVQPRGQGLAGSGESQLSPQVRYPAVGGDHLVPQDVALQGGGQGPPRLVVSAPDVHVELGERLRHRQLPVLVHVRHPVEGEHRPHKGHAVVPVGQRQAAVLCQVDAPRRQGLGGQQQRQEGRQKRPHDPITFLHLHSLQLSFWAS